MSYKLRDINQPSPSEHQELLSRTERIWLFAEQHRNAVMIGALLVCLVALSIGAIFWLQNQSEQESLTLERQATQLYLDRSLDDLDASKSNLDKAMTLYQQILDEYPRSSSAELAWYFLGNAHAERENFPDAIKAYEHYASSFTNNPTLQGLVFQRLGSAYILHNQKQKGLDAYTQVLNIPGALNKDQVMFELAKLEESDNNTSQALTHYKHIQDQYPASPYVNEAMMRIRVLEPPQETPEESPKNDSSTATDKKTQTDQGK